MRRELITCGLSALGANWFDRLPRFLPNSASLKPILNQAEDTSPLGSSPLPDLRIAESIWRGNERNPDESPDSTKTIAPPLLITLTLFCFGLSPTAKALLPAPSPDGGYPGGNTAEGINALHDVNTAVGINNTAMGANALTHDTTGHYNVAVGEGACQQHHWQL